MPVTVPRHVDPELTHKARPFDFRRPNKLSRDHVRSLQIVHETFARQFTTVLSSTLRVVSQVSVLSIEQLAYDEYVSDTPNPSHMSILSVEPLPGVAVLQFPLQTAMTIVDLMLGGHGATTGPERPLTDIERGLVRTIIDRVLAELAYAFESVATIEPAVIGYESNPQFAQVAAPSDMTVVIMFDMKIGAVENVASLCFTYSALQPILDTIAAATAHSQVGRHDLEIARERVAHRMLDVPVDLAVEFAPVTLTSGQIVDLQVGDVIPLGHPTDLPLTGTVDGTPAFRVRPARSGKRLAGQVVDEIDPRRAAAAAATLRTGELR
ncbi:flagellar motor switch protein FliM [Actinomarinicola tropica]|uniref:Flagellar motor switch protein FliM n=1 Tax=Actinomarinicola tropica TaxID=2789776 RepID=A0A5Q2RG23_9ACTN|nr:flagellar motor switch protein FliM [Actinomarinicola tropica]QGG94653.1 flagellar motor switch protein FliM [Actinomarinicola tropica]